MNKLLATGIFVFFILGCSVHKPHVMQPLEVPESYSVMTGEGPAPGRWWEQFKDEKLNGLMEEAFRNNLDLSQAYERLRQLEAAGRITGSSARPFINLEGSSGRIRQPGAFGTTEQNTYGLSVRAGYELDIWQKLGSRTRAARLEALASREAIKALYMSLSARLADLYYLAAEQRAQLDLSDNVIASLEDTLRRVEQRYQGGLVSALDIYQARQNLSGARAQRPQFEAALAVTQHAVSILLGHFPKEAMDAGSNLVQVLEIKAGIPSELLKQRPDIEAALLRLRASDERVGATIADRFPSLTLAGGYGSSKSATATFLSSGSIFWNVLLNIAQPVLDSGRRKAEVERSRALFRENLARYHQTVLRAFQEVEDALARNRATEERLKPLEDQVAASSNALRLSESRYMQGLSDYLPVLTSQQLFYNSRRALLSARRQLISDRIQLARALGGQWAEQEVRERLSIDKNGH